MFLEPNTWSLWLGDTAAAIDLMRPAGDDVLQLWPVSRAVNSVRNNGAELLGRIENPHAPLPSDAPAKEIPPRRLSRLPDWFAVAMMAADPILLIGPSYSRCARSHPSTRPASMRARRATGPWRPPSPKVSSRHRRPRRSGQSPAPL